MVGFAKNRTNRAIVDALFDRFSAHAAEIGFMDAGADIETGGRSWMKEAFDQHYFEVFLWPEQSQSSKSLMSFNVHLSVQSHRQTTVENQLRIWECANLHPHNHLSEKKGDTTVLIASLRWLALAWEPKASLEAVAFWGNVGPSDVEKCVDSIWRCFQQKGLAFFELVATPIKLAQVLCNIHVFPGANSTSGPGSSHASQFAAVLLRDCGKPNEAMEELAHEYKALEARVHRGERDQIDLEILRCKRAKYENWIQG